MAPRKKSAAKKAASRKPAARKAARAPVRKPAARKAQPKKAAKPAARKAQPKKVAKPAAGKAAPKKAAKGRFGSLAAVLASQGGPRGIAPTRLVAEPAFLAEVKPLFWGNQEREAAKYEDVMYNIDEMNPNADDFERVLTFRGVGAVPSLGKADNEERVRKVLRTIRYPDVEPLLGLAKVEGMTLPALTTLLHFYHPSYPLMSRELVRGLNAIGYPVEFREDVGEESVGDYAGVMATLDRLKDRITFENVPESNCFLTRVLEGALVEAARAAGPKGRAKAAKGAGGRKPSTKKKR